MDRPRTWQCWGITKEFRRCKRRVRGYFCGDHKYLVIKFLFAFVMTSGPVLDAYWSLYLKIQRDSRLERIEKRIDRLEQLHKDIDKTPQDATSSKEEEPLEPPQQVGKRITTVSGSSCVDGDVEEFYEDNMLIAKLCVNGVPVYEIVGGREAF